MDGTQCIDHLVISILSPFVPARKMAIDTLTFLCYCDIPSGHSKVLQAMELLREYGGEEYGRFDTWLHSVGTALDGRGKMGSMVGVSKDLILTDGTKNPDSILLEYSVRIKKYILDTKNSKK